MFLSRGITTLIALAQLLFFFASATDVPGSAIERGLKQMHEDLRLIVRYTPAYTKDQTGAHSTALRAKPGVRSVKALPNVRMAVVSCDSPDTVERLMLELASERAVENVMPDTMIYLGDPSNELSTAAETGRSATNTTEKDQIVVPNDPLFDQLWGMGLSKDGGIDAVKAWTRTTGQGMPEITVAVIDSGVDYRHADLKDQMWVNPGEIPDNGIDDDGNGYIDDVHGANLIDGSGDPDDDFGHGTHCAGTIAAIGNNSKGVAGVAWAGVKLMALKFITKENTARTSDGIAALEYAIANGARISSNSWGIPTSSNALRAAVERVAEARMLFVAAAGNDRSNNDFYPTYPSGYNIDSIISVAATNVLGKIASFSNYGDSVDVAAPGDEIFSCAPKDDYVFMSGTSMAAPHVSGLAALVWMFRPELSTAQVREVLLNSTLKLATLTGWVHTGGQVNAYDALALASAVVVEAPPVHYAKALMFKDTDDRLDVVSGTVTITAAANESDIDYYKLWIVSEGGYPLMELGEVEATGVGEYHFKVTEEPLPAFAAGLMVVTGNSTGVGSPWNPKNAPTIALIDYVIPAFGPGAVAWAGDTCVEKGCVGGVLTVQRPPDESALTGYDVYWEISDGDEDFKALAGSFPAIGFQHPVCEGKTCSSISMGKTSAEGRTYIWHSRYAPNEHAVITFSGPAKVKLVQFATETGFDFMDINGQALAGVLEEGQELVLDLPEEFSTIEWQTDSFVSGGRWALEIFQENTHAEFVVPSQLPRGDRLYAVAVRDNITAKAPSSTSVSVLDYNTKMPPSPAFSPTGIAWAAPTCGDGQDVIDHYNTVGDIPAVWVELLYSTPATFVQVAFADSKGHVLGTHWRVELMDEAIDCPDSAEHDSLRQTCRVKVPLTGLSIAEGNSLECADVCSEDQCVGTDSNSIPVGETWMQVGESDSGCCFMGWGSCSRCCKVETVLEDGSTRIPEGAKAFIARAGNRYGMARGNASMELGELGRHEAVASAAAAAAPSKEYSPRLRGVGIAAKGQSVEKQGKASSSSVIPQKSTANPWLSRLGAVVPAKTKSAAPAKSRKVRLSPDRLVGSIEIQGWDAQSAPTKTMDATLAKALASVVGDDTSKFCDIAVTRLAAQTSSEADGVVATQVEFEITPKDRLKRSGTRYSLEGATISFLDMVEARFALLGMGGALSREVDEKLLGALQATEQPMTRPRIRYGFITQSLPGFPNAGRSGTGINSPAAAEKTSLPNEFYP
eukprot:TRINITY_DN2881_c0_g1_i9.p1 TRINITY_DN2881_c0_g1~~TRINITY_DN2881_c0_g1_i9.p1  ORF type:complete len:1267 (-),score=181.53 TRINITY_DN2881_c0_g1_i9:485-4225(-)